MQTWVIGMKQKLFGHQIGSIKMHKLFVYGTLKKGFSRNTILKDSSFIGDVTTKPSFTMIDLTYFPGILEIGNTSIYGELYEVSDETLQYCDVIEGHPDFYKRIEVELTNNTTAWCYVLDYTKYENPLVISSGKWE